jgi:hypothetical protein
MPKQIRGLAGELVVYAPDGLDVDVALEQLCTSIHGKLIRSLTQDANVAPDLVTAHVAHAIAINTVRPNDVRNVKFACFSPRSLDARAAASLLRGSEPITLIRPDALPDPDPEVIELVDDGSLTAHTIMTDLGDRLQRARPQRRLERATPTQAPPSSRPAPPRPPPPHKLQALIDLLRARILELGLGSYNCPIVDEDKPMFAYTGDLIVAGNDPRLLALAAALSNHEPWAQLGVDVVVAHAVTVLNRELAQITDASETHALGVLLANPPR